MLFNSTKKSIRLNNIIIGLTCYKGRCQEARCVQKGRVGFPLLRTPQAPTPACNPATPAGHHKDTLE